MDWRALSGAMAVLAGCMAASAKAAEDSGMSAATRTICASVADSAPPVSDLPTPGQAADLKGCDAEALYYGIGRPADPARARLCAFVQRQAKADIGNLSDAFQGDAMLMVIYANGVGARRDLRLATRFACGIDSAPAEFDGRVADLTSRRKSGSAGQGFSFCDDITSGLAEGQCAYHDQRIASALRASRLDAYAARLQGAAAARFAELRAAQAAWSKARSDNEIDLSGTARAAMVLGEQDMQDKDFLAMIERLQGGKPPRLGAAQLRTATARMEDRLGRIRAADQGRRSGWGTVTPDQIGQAQKAWIRYRDAWGAFAAAAYPAWGSDAAEAWVTMKRADMLGAFLK